MKTKYKIEIRLTNKHNELEEEIKISRSSKAIAENAAIKMMEKEGYHAKNTIDGKFGEIWIVQENQFDEYWIENLCPWR